MSFQFGFGWAKSDPNDLCMREVRSASEFSNARSASSNPGAFILRFSMDEGAVADLSNVQSYEMDGDFEQISTQMVCRFLLKCPGCVVFPRGGLPELSTNVNNNMLSVVKNKTGIRLKKKPPQTEEESTDSPEDVLYHSIMFQAFHALLEQGYQVFATEDQLRGVVARKIDNSMLEVCAFRNCVINHQESEGLMNVEVFRYKFTPLKVEDLPLHPLEDTWRKTSTPVQCVFLPTQEEVHLVAVTTFRTPIPASPRATAAYESSLLLTALDLANKARGFSAYLPETYEKARQYWELAYGFVLPRVPDGVMFGRIQTALGEQVVPLQVLVRGAVETPWKSSGDPLACATRVHHCLQHRIPQLRTLHSPQHPDDLARQLRAAYERTSCGEPTSDGAGAGVSGRPVRTLFVSALRMKNAQTTHMPPHLHTSRATTTTTEPPPCIQVSKHEDEEDSGGLFDEEEDFFADTPKPPVQVTKPLPPPPPPKVPPVQKTQAVLVKPVLTAARGKAVPESVTVATTRPPQEHNTATVGGAAGGDSDDDGDTASLSQDLSDSSQSSLLCTPPENTAGAGVRASSSSARPVAQAPPNSAKTPAATKRKASPAEGDVAKTASARPAQKPTAGVHSDGRGGGNASKVQAVSKGRKGGKK